MEEHYEEYRLRAAYCREMSQVATSPLMRAEWCRLANTWLAMIPRDAILVPWDVFDPAHQCAA